MRKPHPDVALAIAFLNFRNERRHAVVRAVAVACGRNVIGMRRGAELVRGILVDDVAPDVVLAEVHRAYALDARALAAPVEARRQADAREGRAIVIATPEEVARVHRDIKPGNVLLVGIGGGR